MVNHWKRWVAITIAVVVGGLLPFRPFFFTRPSDPTVETIDLIISPAYLLGRALPPMGDFGSVMFLAGTVLTNALLYGLVARYILGKIYSAP